MQNWTISPLTLFLVLTFLDVIQTFENPARTFASTSWKSGRIQGVQHTTTEQAPFVINTDLQAQHSQEVSDLDREVLQDLLNDPAFVQSLDEKNQTISKSLKEDLFKERPKKESIFTGISEDGEFKSSTFKKAEELQESFGSFWGGFQAALESAAIYVVNKVASDIKLVEATASYLSQRAIFDTRRTLAAAKEVSKPIALLGQAVEEAQKNNLTITESAELLGLGLLDSVGEERRLGAFQDFDDTGKRLDRAYQRKLQEKGPALPIRAATALPELANKASDLVYEVDREIKYEEAGRKVKEIGERFGIDTSFLLGPTSQQKALGQAKEEPVSKKLLMGEAQASDLDRVEAEENNAETLDLSFVQTYGDLLELLEQVNPEFRSFQQLDKQLGNIYSDDDILDAINKSIKEDKNTLKDLQDIASQISENDVKQPLVEGIGLQQSAIERKIEWVEICKELNSAIDTWDENFIEMNKDFQNALQLLQKSDKVLFNDEVEFEKPLPAQVEKYVFVLVKGLQTQRESQDKVLVHSERLLTFLKSRAIASKQNTDKPLSDPLDAIFSQNLENSSSYKMLQEICTTLQEVPNKSIAEILSEGRGNHSFQQKQNSFEDSVSQEEWAQQSPRVVTTSEYLQSVEEQATRSPKELKESSAKFKKAETPMKSQPSRGFSDVDTVGKKAVAIEVDEVIHNRTQGSEDINQRKAGMKCASDDVDIIIPDVLNGKPLVNISKERQSSSTKPISSALTTTSTSYNDPEGLVRYGDDEAIDTNASFEKEDSEKATEFALKSLDILILLIEKLVTVGVPAIISISEVSSQRIINVYGDVKKNSSKGWQLLSGVRSKK